MSYLSKLQRDTSDNELIILKFHNLPIPDIPPMPENVYAWYAFTK